MSFNKKSNLMTLQFPKDLYLPHMLSMVVDEAQTKIHPTSFG